MWHHYLEMACEGDRTLVGAAKLNQISRMVSFMLLESGGGGMSGRSFFRSSDSTPSSCTLSYGTSSSKSHMTHFGGVSIHFRVKSKAFWHNRPANNSLHKGCRRANQHLTRRFRHPNYESYFCYHMYCIGFTNPHTRSILLLLFTLEQGLCSTAFATNNFVQRHMCHKNNDWHVFLSLACFTHSSATIGCLRLVCKAHQDTHFGLYSLVQS